ERVRPDVQRGDSHRLRKVLVGLPSAIVHACFARGSSGRRLCGRVARGASDGSRGRVALRAGPRSCVILVAQTSHVAGRTMTNEPNEEAEVDDDPLIEEVVDAPPPSASHTPAPPPPALRVSRPPPLPSSAPSSSSSSKPIPSTPSEVAQPAAAPPPSLQ